MSAHTLPPIAYNPDEDWLRPILGAVLVHLLVVLIFGLAWLWSPTRNTNAAAGEGTLEASLELSGFEIAAAQRALNQSIAQSTTVQPQPATPTRQDVPLPAVEPTPIPPTVVPVIMPDTQEQMRVLAEQQRQQQEAERQRQAELAAEQQRQQEAAAQLAQEQQQEAERQQKIVELRQRREQLEQQAAEEQQRLERIRNEQRRANQAVAAASNSASSSSANNSGAANGGSAGNGGDNSELLSRYSATIQQAVLRQWIRPESIPLGQRCRLTINQIPGGSVSSVQFDPGCPYDEAGRRSVEAAILRASPLPYHGFESVFQRTLNFNFIAQDR